MTVKPDLSLSIGDDVVTGDGLAAALDAASEGNHDERIFLRADKAVGYGDLMTVMNKLRSAGYLKVALVLLQSDEQH